MRCAANRGQVGAEYYGTRRQGAKLETMDWQDDRLSDRERAFVSDRDGFYVASVGENGWPYLQFRGGPRGFVNWNCPQHITPRWTKDELAPVMTEMRNRLQELEEENDKLRHEIGRKATTGWTPYDARSKKGRGR
jgi:hypothetical protein